MSNVYFSSDTHFNHSNIIKYSNRPFLTDYEKEQVRLDPKFKVSYESTKLMNDTLINNINKKIGPQDILYFLGDFCFSPSGQYYKDARHFRDRINCKNIYLIYGNHDKDGLGDFFKDAWHLKEIKVFGQRIVLCHFALRVWNRSHHGTWHLYGHSHGSLPNDPFSRSFDVGVDCHNYMPLSFEEVKNIISKKQFRPVDHHVSGE